MSPPAEALEFRSLVPTARLGAALHRERTRAGATMAELARRSGGVWLPDDLLAIEQGAHRLSDDEVVRVVELYELPPQRWLTASSVEFVLDRTPVASGASASASKWDHGTSQREIARAFVAVAVAIGIDLASGVRGLAAVADAMESEPSEVLSLAGDSLRNDGDNLRARIDHLDHSVVVPSAGLLVTEAPVGSLIMIHTSRRGGFVPTVPAAGRLGALRACAARPTESD